MNGPNNQRLFNIGGGGDSPPISNIQGQQQLPQMQGANVSGQGLGRIIPLPKTNFKIVHRSPQHQQQQQLEEGNIQAQGQQQRILYRSANGNGSPQPQRFVIQGQASGNPLRIQNYGRSKSLSQAHPAQFQQQHQQGIPALQFRKSINTNNPGVGMRKLQPPQLIRATLPSAAVTNHSSNNLGTSSPAISNASSATPPSTPGSAAINANPPKPKRLKSIQMRLKCRASALPLHTTYFEDNMVVEKDADVVFICGDGGRVRGHKIILASLSKLFTDIFMDQPLGEVSYVSMPDIRSDTMKLIILLGYKPDIYITKEQIDLLKDQFDILRINFEGMTIDEANSVVNLDVEPGKVVENIDIHKRYPFENNKRPQSPLKHHGQGQKLPHGFAQNRSGTFGGNGTYHHQRYNEESDDEPFKIQGYPTENHFEHRKSGLNPRPELADDDDDEEYRDAPAAASPSSSSEQDPIKEWMANVGKTETEQGKYKCSTCKTGFEKEEIFKWHEARHYGEGLFRCTMCDTIKVNARAIWNHEESVHKLVGIPLTEVEEAESNSQRLNLLRLAQIRKAKAAKFGSRPELKSTSKPFPQTNHAIKIGHGELTDGSLNWNGMDSKKVKQLHWLYVCARCDNCAGSTGSAFGHYKKCYDEEGARPTFENTITKYRQGFYGKYACPLCPRKYLGNGGITIHCGHQHAEYRKMFTYTGAHEDKLKCNHCHRKYSSPEDFHHHLQNGTQCIQDPINEDSMPQLTKNNSSTAPERKKKVVEEKESKKEEKVAKPLPPPPRSARLAKRASALLMAKVLSEKDESDEDKAATKTTTTKRRSVALDYPPAECPICGSEVDNISQHLATEHSDLNVNVNRVSTELLRCRKCLLTFAICDLLSHSSNCGKSKPTQSGEESETSSDTTEIEKPRKDKVVKAPAEPLPIPPGVGCSPIDSMDLTLEELTNKEVLTNFFICSVCGYKGAKMGGISRCLQTHGIVRCSLCFNTYLNRQDYETHLSKLHQIGTKFLCPFTANGTCTAKAYSNIGQCVGHLQNCHWDMQFKNRTKKGASSSSTKGAAMNDTMAEIEGTEDMEEDAKPVEEETTTTISDDNATEKTSDDDRVPEIDKIEHDSLPTIFKNKEEAIEDTESSRVEVENGSKKETKGIEPNEINDENQSSSTGGQMSDNDNKAVNEENREIKAGTTEDIKDSVSTTEEVESTQIEGDDKMDTTT